MGFFVVVGAGGVLFEYFLLLHTNDHDVKILETTFLNNQQFPEETKNAWVDQFSLIFWYDSIQIMHQVNQKCTQPLLLWHMLLDFRGLSITGQRIGAAVKASLPESTYERKKEAMIIEYDEKLRQMLRSNSAVLTTDNFSKSWGSPTLALNRTTQYINTNFTVSTM